MDAPIGIALRICRSDDGLYPKTCRSRYWYVLIHLFHLVSPCNCRKTLGLADCTHLEHHINVEILNSIHAVMCTLLVLHALGKTGSYREDTSG